VGDQGPPLGDAGEELKESAESQSPHLLLAHVRESISVRLIPPGPVPGVGRAAPAPPRCAEALVWNPLALVAPIPAPHPLASAAAPFAQAGRPPRFPERPW